MGCCCMKRPGAYREAKELSRTDSLEIDVPVDQFKVLLVDKYDETFGLWDDEVIPCNKCSSTTLDFIAHVKTFDMLTSWEQRDGDWIEQKLGFRHHADPGQEPEDPIRIQREVGHLLRVQIQDGRCGWDKDKAHPIMHPFRAAKSWLLQHPLLSPNPCHPG